MSFHYVRIMAQIGEMGQKIENFASIALLPANKPYREHADKCGQQADCADHLVGHFKDRGD